MYRLLFLLILLLNTTKGACSQAHQVDFGSVSGSYAAARRGYPEEVYSLIKKHVKPQACIVDVCCGTGISTRELRDHGFKVIGVDRDQKMIDQALQAEGNSIPYVLYNLEDGLHNSSSIPNQGVAAITVFTGFHWFDESKEALDGIYESLQENGYFIIVSGLGFTRGKGDSVQAEVERAIANVIGPLPEKTVDLEASLGGRFKIVEQRSISNSATYTPEQFFDLMRSRNYWEGYRNSIVAKIIESEIIGIINKRKGPDGLIHTTGNTRVVVAQKIPLITS